MANIQVRLLEASLVMVAGALASHSSSLDVNVAIVMIILGGAIFIAEYIRSYTRKA